MMPQHVHKLVFPLLVSLTVWLSATGVSFGRNIFLNGVDISSTRSQLLENVTIQIDDKGDLFINAPNYVVQEEENYVPLAKTQQAKQLPMTIPEHKAPMALQGPDAKKRGATQDDTDLAPKGGSKQDAADAKAPSDKTTSDKTTTPPPQNPVAAEKATTESASPAAKVP